MLKIPGKEYSEEEISYRVYQKSGAIGQSQYIVFLLAFFISATVLGMFKGPAPNEYRIP